MEHYVFGAAKWFPDSKQIMFVGYEAGHGPRCYVQNVEAGKPRAFSLDGMMFCTVSPTGGILALAKDFRALLYNSQSSQRPDKEFKLEQGEVPIAWTSDGKFLYLAQTVKAPPTITRFEVASGHRSLWKQIPLPPSRTRLKSEGLVITPDGQSYAYTYSNHSSDLYLVQGLK